PALGGAEELDHTAVGGPCRSLVLPAVGEQPFVAAVRGHYADAEVAGDLGKGDEVAARAPFRSRVATAAETDAPLVRTIGVHHIELLAARTIAFEDDARPVRRIAAADIDARRSGEALRLTAVHRDAIDVGIAADRHRIEDVAAVGREARRPGLVGT